MSFKFVNNVYVIILKNHFLFELRRDRLLGRSLEKEDLTGPANV